MAAPDMSFGHGEVSGRPPPAPVMPRGTGRSLHVLMTVNAAWNILNFRRPLVEAFLAAGHRLTVLAPPDGSVPALERQGLHVVPLEMDVKGLSPWQDYQLIGRFRRHFAGLRPDIVLSYTIKNNIFGAIAATSEGIPFIPNVTGLGTAFLAASPIRLTAEMLYRHAFRGLAQVFFQNDEDRALFVERGLIEAHRTRVLPGSGVDLRHFAPAPMPGSDQPPIFLMIGRLLRDKGTLEFVEAARRVRRKYPAVRFRLLGAVGAENRTAIGMAEVAAWQDAGVIEHVGPVEDVRPFIADAICVVLPSYREGAPRTLIEAAAMARPLIATDVPGCRSVVEHGVNGLLCQPRSAESLAAACLQMLALDPGCRSAMGLAGRRKMERDFDQAHVVAAYRHAIAAATAAPAPGDAGEGNAPVGHGGGAE